MEAFPLSINMPNENYGDDSDGYSSSAENSSAEYWPISGTNVPRSVGGRPRKAKPSRGRPRKHQKTDTTVAEMKTLMPDVEVCRVSSNIN